MEMLYWAGGVVLLALFAWIALLNAYVFWLGICGKEDLPSSIPLLGGVFGVIGLVLLPAEVGNPWIWLPLLLDYGCIPLLVLTAAYYLTPWGRQG